MNKPERILGELLARYPDLRPCEAAIRKAFEAITGCYRSGGKVLIAGNGGSCSDAGHIVGELMKDFMIKRPIPEDLRQSLLSMGNEYADLLAQKLQGALPAIDLTAHSALITAFGNDVDAKLAYAQQVVGYGRKGDVLIGISTSGNAENIAFAIFTARAAGLMTIGLTGGTGGRMKDIADIVICVPGDTTAKIQELHLPIYHALCAMVEAEIFGS
ncbi:MAG TPA: SIS domain-containing protein [Candidatus Atribacteria bacterium]|nr:SIS domain-containing protein [Candidatus Atribacteria bacterium]HPT78916.1 SIS domain-containing protein [Candidatus Atribacteria bacterium]